MYRYRRSSSPREALGKLLGTGPQTFYAVFKRYKIPETTRTKGSWVLLTTVTDEDCTLLTDHLWAVLPPSSRYCSWALEPRTVLRLVAQVGKYETRRYDPVLIRSVGLTDYNFDPVFDYAPIKHFPLFTPRFERDCEAFFDKLLARPELVKRWSRTVSWLPKPFLPYPLSLPPKSTESLGNVRVCQYLPNLQMPKRLLMASSI